MQSSTRSDEVFGFAVCTRGWPGEAGLAATLMEATMKPKRQVELKIAA